MGNRVSVLFILTQFLPNRSRTITARFNHNHIMVDGCRSKLVNVVSGVFWAPYCFSGAHRIFFPFWRIKTDRLWQWFYFAICLSPGVRVRVAESLNRDLGKVIASGVTYRGWDWMRVRLRLWESPVHLQSPPLTIGGTVLKESVGWVL